MPVAFIAMNGRQWMQNWHPGMHVNDSNGQNGTAGNNIEYLNANAVGLARRGVRNRYEASDARRLRLRLRRRLPELGLRRA